MEKKYRKKVKMLHQKETLIKDKVNKSLTTQHCEFFLKKSCSEGNKIFKDYLQKYYPRNSSCSYASSLNKSNFCILPKIQEKPLKKNQTQSKYKKYPRFCFNQFQNSKENYKKYQQKVNEILNKIRLETVT